MFDSIKVVLTAKNTKPGKVEKTVRDRVDEGRLGAAIKASTKEMVKSMDDLEALVKKLPESGNADSTTRATFAVLDESEAQHLGFKEDLTAAFNDILTPSGSIRDDHRIPDFLHPHKVEEICVEIAEALNSGVFTTTVLDPKAICRAHFGSYRGNHGPTAFDVKVAEKVYGPVLEQAQRPAGEIDLGEALEAAAEMKKVYTFELYRPIELLSKGFNGYQPLAVEIGCRLRKSANKTASRDRKWDAQEETWVSRQVASLFRQAVMGMASAKTAGGSERQQVSIRRPGQDAKDGPEVVRVKKTNRQRVEDEFSS